MTDVNFDFHGALQLARELHALAVGLERMLAARGDAATEALRRWRGPHAETFRARAAAEDDETKRLVAALTVEALDWAQAWADATNEANRRARLREVQHVAAERGVGERLVDLVVGDDSDSQVPPAVVVTPPRSPDFLP